MKQVSTCQNIIKTINLKDHKRSYHCPERQHPTAHITATNSYLHLLQYVPKSLLHNVFGHF
jgi:hypothetical protein